MGRSTAAAALHDMAAPTFGVVLTGELRSAGYDPRSVKNLIESGWLAVVRRGAYLVGGGTPTDWQHLVAAYRVAGPDAVVSHWSAARLHRLPVASATFQPELTIVEAGDRRMEGVRIHRAGVRPSEITVARGLRATTPARTLRDIASQLERRAIESLVDEGLIAGTWTLDELTATIASASRRTSIGLLREVVALRTSGPSPVGKVDSHLELRVARVLASCGPFETGYQVVLNGQVFVLDIAWPDLMVAVESEGWQVRAKSRSKFDRERRKFNVLAAKGWTVLHVTAAMSDDEIRAHVVPVLLAAAGRRGRGEATGR